MNADVRDFNIIKRVFNGFDAVFHLAAIVSVPESIRNPELTFDVNFKGTFNVARACVENNIKKLVFASSCAVYGDPHYLPVDENHPLKPKLLYVASKVSAEMLLQSFAKSYGLNVVSLRLFNVYGETKRDYAGVVMKFIERIKKGLPQIIYSNGYQTRDFIYIKDVVNAFLLAMEKDLKGYNVFNIGSGKEVGIKELAEIVYKNIWLKSQTII